MYQKGSRRNPVITNRTLPTPSLQARIAAAEKAVAKLAGTAAGVFAVRRLEELREEATR